MADITASMVSELRQRTGAGMMDCKKALVAHEGDMDKAAEELRKMGAAKADKKADRLAKDGLIRIHKTDDRHGAMLVLNCETDFVAKGDKFQALANDLVQYFTTSDLGSVKTGESLKGEGAAPAAELPYKDGQTVGEAIRGLIAVIGENMQLSALAVERSENANDYLQDYLHGNRVGVLVCLTTGKPETHNAPAFREVAKDIAMQVATGMPAVAIAVNRDAIDPAVIEKERAFLLEQALSETPGGPNFKGDPQEIAEKKVSGRMNKFFEEVSLLDQPYIRDEKSRIADVIKKAEQEVGDTITVARFHRFELGG
jgi:elongation factor Ts